MPAPKTFLVLNPGAVHSKVSSLEFDGQKLQLISSTRVLTSYSYEGMLRSLRNYFPGQFSQILIIGQASPKRLKDNQVFVFEDEAYSRALNFLSANSEVMLLYLGREKIIKGEASYGRMEIKKDKYLFRQPLKITNLLGEGFGTKIARWLPYGMDILEVENCLARRVLYPGVLPQTEQNQYLEASYGRQLLRKFAKSDFHWGKTRLKEVYLVGDIFTNIHKAGEILLTLLDGIEPEGAFRVYWDPQQIIVSLGGLLQLGEELFSKQALREFLMSNLICLSSVMVFSHRRTWGQALARVFFDLGLDEQLKVEIKSGEIIRVPFERRQEGAVTLHIGRGVEIKSESFPEIPLVGGELGIVLDGRGRPLIPPEINPQDREKVESWRKVLMS